MRFKQYEIKVQPSARNSSLTDIFFEHVETDNQVKFCRFAVTVTPDRLEKEIARLKGMVVEEEKDLERSKRAWEERLKARQKELKSDH